MMTTLVKSAVLLWWGDAVTPEGRCLVFVFEDEDREFRRFFTPLHAVPGNKTDRVLTALGIHTFYGGVNEDGTLIIPRRELQSQPCRIVLRGEQVQDVLTEQDTCPPEPTCVNH